MTYTPTTEEVKDSATEYNGLGIDPDAFDRWLAEHDRQIAEAAFDEGVDQVSVYVLYWHPQATGPYNPYRKDTDA